MPYLSDLDLPRPRVSVVMPVYNERQHLAAAVESILQQTLQELELVIIDDGSDDDTLLRLQVFERADPRVRVYHQHHAGIVTALNYGFSMAKALYVARMDADDLAFP